MKRTKEGRDRKEARSRRKSDPQKEIKKYKKRNR